jgi:Bacterial Ig-like domain (group 3)
VIAQTGSVAFGQTVTLTATVKNMSAVIGVPDGEVTFFDGATVLGTGQLRGGKASITVKNLPIGRDSIRVVYGGSAFAPSTSSDMIVSVHADDPSTRPALHIKAVVIDNTGSAGRGALLRRQNGQSEH